MIYYSNGGFNWNDLYYMPVKLREFYWNRLLKEKDSEKEAQEGMIRKSKTGSPSKVTRR
jgi:hypothetical protein